MNQIDLDGNRGNWRRLKNMKKEPEEKVKELEEKVKSLEETIDKIIVCIYDINAILKLGVEHAIKSGKAHS